MTGNMKARLLFCTLTWAKLNKINSLEISTDAFVSFISIVEKPMEISFANHLHFRRLLAPNVQKKVFLAGGATATSTSASQVGSDISRYSSFCGVIDSSIRYSREKIGFKNPTPNDILNMSGFSYSYFFLPDISI